MGIYDLLKKLGNINYLSRIIPEDIIKNSSTCKSLENENRKNLEEINSLKKEIINLPTKIKKELQYALEEKIEALKQKQEEKIDNLRSSYQNNIYNLREALRKSRLELVIEKEEIKKLKESPIVEIQKKEISTRKKYNEYMNEARDIITALERQLELAKGNISFKVEKIKKLENRDIVILFKLLEGTETIGTEFSKSIGLYVDHSFKPLYATAGFYSTYNISETNLKLEHKYGILDYLDKESRHEILNFAHGRTKKIPKIKVNIAENEYSLRFKPTLFLDEENKLLGTFIQLRDIEQGMIEKLKQRKQTNYIANLLEKITRLFKENYLEQLKLQKNI